MNRAFVTLILLLALLLVSDALAQPTQSASRREIDRLILQLSDGQAAKREEATRRLIEMGDQAIPALEAAMKDPDPELGLRAAAVYRVLTKLTPERRDAIAQTARDAFAAADYPAAARQQAILARQARATIDECLALGHDWQLANRWPEAVAGYQRALQRVEQVLAGDPETDPPPAPPPPGNGFNGRQPNGLGKAGPVGLTDFRRRELSALRAGLVLLIGRLQREKLSDGQAAVATLERVTDFTPEFAGDLPALLPKLASDVTDRRARREVPHDVGRGLSLLNEFDAMEELARTQESLGKTDDAILTLARLSNAMLHTRDDGVDDHLAKLTALIGRSAKVRALPGAAALVKLTPALAAPPQLRADAEPFDNPASPFAWEKTNLAQVKLGPVTVWDVTPRPGGRWFAVLGAGPRLFTATSRDLLTWDAPRELPHNGLANNVEPALTVDGDGTLWLAWFSNRLSLSPRSSGGYQLWLASSKDGRDWSPPRAIAADTGGWPMGGLHWLRTAGGTFRLSWRAAAATVTSPAELKNLTPIDVFVPQQTWPMDPHVVQDDKGRLHMVLDDRLRGVIYTTSPDGVKWSQPVVLVDKNAAGEAMERPHVIVDGKRFGLIYRVGSQTFLRKGSLAEPTKISDAVKIADGPVMRWLRAGDEVIGLAGGGNVWRLKARVADLVR